MQGSQIVLAVQTMDVEPDGAALREVHPAQDGIYHKVPLALLGKASRNGLTYDIPSAKRAMTDPKSMFAVNIREGNQEGEWGHPPRDSSTARLVEVVSQYASHFIRAIYFEDLTNYTIVYGDIGPTGPYGQYLIERFADPRRNASFSLRCASRRPNHNPNMRIVKSMITFDAVGGPGFAQASKRHMAKASQPDISAQSATFEKDVQINDLLTDQVKHSLFSIESITDQDVLDLFQTSEVRINEEPIGLFDTTSNTIVNVRNGRTVHRSAMHEMMRRIR